MTKTKYAEFRVSGEPLQIREVEIPELKQGEILVRNEYTTLCRSDLNTFSGKRKETTPTILGHEIVGRIADFGPGTSRTDSRYKELNSNDRITWAIYASDPTSELAKQGIPQKAAGLFKYGHEQITDKSNLHGGLSEYTILRANTPIAKVSENVPLKLTSIINCAVATTAGTLRLAGSVKNKNVLISGSGMLGVIACAMCKVQNSNKIVALDINPERLETAKLFGADSGITSLENLPNEIKNGLNQSRPFHLAIDFSGVADVMEETLQHLAIGGTAVWVGATHPQRDVQINAEKIIRNLWTIKGLHNYNESDFINALDFIENNYNIFPFESLVHDKFTFEQVNEAFEYALKENPFRVGIGINPTNKWANTHKTLSKYPHMHIINSIKDLPDLIE
jgi:putative phosphonate catabolism associated alcohol dehydrogenase